MHEAYWAGGFPRRSELLRHAPLRGHAFEERRELTLELLRPTLAERRQRRAVGAHPRRLPPQLLQVLDRSEARRLWRRDGGLSVLRLLRQISQPAPPAARGAADPAPEAEAPPSSTRTQPNAPPTATAPRARSVKSLFGSAAEVSRSFKVNDPVNIV